MPVKFEEFKVRNVLKFDSSNGIFHAINVKISNDRLQGYYPYVVRTSQNNGIRGYIKEDEIYLNPEKTISFAQDTTQMFYQKDKYFTGNKVKVVSIIGKEMNENIALYLISSMNKAFSVFSWGTSFETDKLLDVNFKLPIVMNEDGEPLIEENSTYHKNGYIPDWDYMDSCIDGLNTVNVKKIVNYLKDNELDDTELTEEEKQILVEHKDTKEVKISKVLKWMPQKEIDPLKIKELTVANDTQYPFYGQATINNGIIGYLSLDEKVLNNKKSNSTILIHSNNQNIVYLDTPFYLKDGHGATSILQSANLTEPVALYLIACIKKVIKEKFTYNDKATKIALKNTYIEVPIDKDCEIDYEYMTKYIKAIEKNVIKKLRNNEDLVV